MNDKDTVLVRNRNNGFTGYSIPDMGIWRNFAPKESKRIPLEELKRLQFQPGGDYVLENLLIIESKEALKELNMLDHIELEYNYTEKDIQRLLLESPVEELEDFLDFAPDGAIEIAKDMAVTLKIPDNRKREAITKATGFNITSAINLNQVLAEDNEVPKETAKKERRVKVSAEPEKKTRRVSQPTAQESVKIPSYKVVEK